MRELERKIYAHLVELGPDVADVNVEPAGTDRRGNEIPPILTCRVNKRALNSLIKHHESRAATLRKIASRLENN